MQRTASGTMLAAGIDVSDALNAHLASLGTPGAEIEAWGKRALARTVGTNIAVLHPQTDLSYVCEWVPGDAGRCAFVIARENGWAVWVPNSNACDPSHHRGVAVDMPLTGSDGFVFAAAVAANHQGLATAFAQGHKGPAERNASLGAHPLFGIHGARPQQSAQVVVQHLDEEPAPSLSAFAAAVSHAVRAQARQDLARHPEFMTYGFWRSCTDALDEVRAVNAVLARLPEDEAAGASANAYCLINEAARMAPALGPGVAAAVDKQRAHLESRFW